MVFGRTILHGIKAEAVGLRAMLSVVEEVLPLWLFELTHLWPWLERSLVE